MTNYLYTELVSQLKCKVCGEHGQDSEDFAKKHKACKEFYNAAMFFVNSHQVDYKYWNSLWKVFAKFPVERDH